MKVEKELLSELNKRLGVVISLLLLALPKKRSMLSRREQIKLLSNLGMRPKDIAEIFGRTQAYINKELVTIKKKNAKEKE